MRRHRQGCQSIGHHFSANAERHKHCSFKSVTTSEPPVVNAFTWTIRTSHLSEAYLRFSRDPCSRTGLIQYFGVLARRTCVARSKAELTKR